MDSNDTNCNKIYNLEYDLVNDILEPESCKYFTTQQFNDTMDKVTNDTFSIIHINSQSLKRKFSKITEFFGGLKKNFKVIAITETWLKEEYVNTIQIEGYNFFYVNRNDRGGGGVGLYVDSDLKCNIVEKKTFVATNLMEIITIEIITDTGKNILLSCVYRPPGPGADLFTNKIIEMFENENNKLVVLCGDFNIDINNSAETVDHKYLMQSIGLCPMITRPTRITTHSATTIDNIYTNIHCNEIINGIFMTDVSDHLPVFIIYEKKCFNRVQDETPVTMRDRSRKAIDALREDLKKQNWEKVYTNDVNYAYNRFMCILTDLYDKNCKKVQIYAHEKKNPFNNPWMTKGLINACKKKNYLYRTFLRLRTNDAEVRYKKYKNKLVSIMRKQKKDYYTKLLDKSKNNTKGTWSILNSVLNKGKAKPTYPEYFSKNNADIYEKDEIADDFNNYFINIGPSLSKNIPIQDIDDGIIPNVNSFFLESIQEEEILTTVHKFANKKSNDFADMNMALIKQIIDVIIKPFTYICNLSFTTGTFPDQMKIAKVLPLFKKGKKNDLANYRPISLLPQFSKILEKLFVVRLNKFINKNNILSNSQYGFRSNHSTSTAIIELAEEITNAMDKEHVLVSVFVDLQKAFDTLDHEILLNKLYKYGIRGVVHQWVKSYLKDRKQFVQINNTKSKYCNIACGVPQGSVLGPVLFLLYVNDIVHASNSLKCILFADDTTLFYSGKNVNSVLEIVEKEFENIMKWFNANKLSLNICKTKFMVFSCKSKDTDATLSVQGLQIERTKEIKFLGVIIDERLTWKSHIEYIKTKVSQTIAVLHKVKEALNKSALFMLYNSLIVPYLTYCIEVWGCSCKTYIESIFLLQKRAIRVVNGSGYRDHTNPIFIHLKSLRFNDLVEYNLLKIMYKAHQKTLPNKLQNRFKKRESKYELRGFEVFSLPEFRTKPKERCISIQGVKLWNDLDWEIKKSPSLNNFKKCVKALLLEKYDH